MSGGFKAWNINELALSLSAVQLDGGGYADDEVATMEWAEDLYSVYVGADKSVTRSRNNNFVALVTLRYAQTADANDRLSALFHADLRLPNGGGAGVFVMRDTEGRLLVTAEKAWITGLPAPKMGKTVQVFEWKIQLADASSSFFGGR